MARDDPAPGGAPVPAPVRAPFRRRTRLVRWAKVLLPLAALGLMSTVFLIAKGPGAPAALPFARLSEIAAGQRLDRPRLAGVASDGTALVLSADRLSPVPGRPDAFALVRPHLEARAVDGRTARLDARAGEVNGPARTVRLTGEVRLEASGDIAVRAATALADLDTGRLTARTVEAEAPFGTLRAGGLEMLGPLPGAGEGPASASMVFNGGVRLLYLPPGASPGTPRSPPAP